MRHCLELIRPADQGEPATYEWKGITPRSAVRIGDQGNVAFVSIEGTIYTWDTSNPGEMPEVLGSHKACANVLAVTGDGRRLVAASDVRLSAWDLQRREMIWSRDDVGVMTLAIHPTSGTITCGTTMGQVLEVDMATGNSLRTVTEHVGGVDCLAISADGTKMASIGVDRRLTLCDWSTGQALWTRPHHANSEVCLSPDGQTLVTSGFVDNAWAIVTWNTATGEEKQKLLGHRNVILGLHVTPDNTLYSWGTDGTVRTWDMRRATVISTWVPHPPYEEVQDVQVNCS
jgi:WD40 repeat protein